MILIIYAHPYPRHSHANQRLLQAVKDIPGVEVRALYELYPDFNIDISAEQRALERADMVVLQHPMQWYSLPPLLKLWIDKVLEHGWAYGHEGNALVGKDCLWAVTSGGDEHHFALGDYPNFAALGQPLQATAIYCGMQWQPYFAVHNTFTCNEPALIAAGEAYRQRLVQYLMEHREPTAEQEPVNG